MNNRLKEAVEKGDLSQVRVLVRNSLLKTDAAYAVYKLFREERLQLEKYEKIALLFSAGTITVKNLKQEFELNSEELNKLVYYLIEYDEPNVIEGIMDQFPMQVDPNFRWERFPSLAWGAAWYRMQGIFRKWIVYEQSVDLNVCAEDGSSVAVQLCKDGDFDLFEQIKLKSRCMLNVNAKNFYAERWGKVTLAFYFAIFRKIHLLGSEVACIDFNARIDDEHSENFGMTLAWHELRVKSWSALSKTSALIDIYAAPLHANHPQQNVTFLQLLFTARKGSLAFVDQTLDRYAQLSPNRVDLGAAIYPVGHQYSSQNLLLYFIINKKSISIQKWIARQTVRLDLTTQFESVNNLNLTFAESSYFNNKSLLEMMFVKTAEIPFKLTCEVVKTNIELGWEPQENYKLKWLVDAVKQSFDPSLSAYRKEVEKLEQTNLINEVVDASTGNTRLHQAVLEKNKEKVFCLITQGANFCIQNNEGKSAFDCALSNEFMDAVNFILNIVSVPYEAHEADAGARLKRALGVEDDKAVVVLSAYVHAAMVSGHGYSFYSCIDDVFHAAAVCSDPKIIFPVLERFKNLPGSRSAAQQTPFISALAASPLQGEDFCKLLSYLLDWEKSISCSNKLMDLFLKALKIKGKPVAEFFYKRMPMVYNSEFIFSLIEKNETKALQTIVDAEVPFQWCDKKEGKNALHHAACVAQWETMCIVYSADPSTLNTTSEVGNNALFLAVMSGVDVLLKMKFLLQRGIHANWKCDLPYDLGKSAILVLFLEKPEFFSQVKKPSFFRASSFVMDAVKLLVQYDVTTSVLPYFQKAVEANNRELLSALMHSPLLFSKQNKEMLCKLGFSEEYTLFNYVKELESMRSFFDGGEAGDLNKIIEAAKGLMKVVWGEKKFDEVSCYRDEYASDDVLRIIVQQLSKKYEGEEICLLSCSPKPY